MTPVMVSLLKSKMRLSFTQACKGFPKISPLPIMRTVYEVYAFEACSQGNTFTMADIPLAKEVEELTKGICHELSAIDEFGRMTYGLSPEDTALAKKYCRGLGFLLGLQMLNYARGNNKNAYGSALRRKMMLDSRRNQLANEFVEAILVKAHDRIANADRGESYYAESRPR